MSQVQHSHIESLTSLCERLRSERLLVGCEQTTLQNLNAKVQSELTELYKLIWTCRHERVVLHRLINSDPSVSPDNCCQFMVAINSSLFNEGYKGYGHHITAISQLFRSLLAAPRAVAEFLNAAEKFNLNPQSMDELNRAIFNVLYGSCVFPNDERSMLYLLAHLITLQLVVNPDPRRVLRKGNTTFSKMYKFFSEELFSAKIFLTAALHEPVMFLLSQDELFLDIDPSKSSIRFPAAERARRFGEDETSKIYKERVARHRQIIVDKLILIGDKFLKAIQQSMSCFPSSLTWLVRQLHTSLIEKKHVSKNEAALICTDLIFTYFFCSAIINPEPLGIISDTPISHIARFNLMQVGQILQTLALMPYEQPPAYMRELLARFDQACMPQIVNTILNSDSLSLESVFPNVVSDSDGSEVYCRKASVGTFQEINIILSCLKSAAIEEINDAPLRKSLKFLMKKMPTELGSTSLDTLFTRNSYGELTRNSESSKILSESVPSNNNIPSRSNSSGKLRNLADKVQNAASKGHQRLMQNSTSSSRIHQRLIQSNSSNFSQYNDTENDTSKINMNLEVFILPLIETDVPIGLASEENIMQAFSKKYNRKDKDSETEKCTRFVATTTESVISDRTTDVPISDEEEDEGPERVPIGDGSSCSSNNEDAGDVGEEEDDEVEEDISTIPDNFSDVVPISANVSARGSPSLSGERVSGRDTPFSANAGERENEALTVSSTVAASATLPAENRRNLPTIPITVRKQNHEGLEEKFGKFALPPQDPSRYRDETYSLVSDSWSTDVGASDNEGFGESINPLQQPIPIVLPSQQIHQHLPIGINGTSVPSTGANPRPVPPSISNVSSNFVHSASSSIVVSGPPPLSSNSVEDEPAIDKPYYDPSNLTQCKAFLDAKRKLRLVLSWASNISKTFGQTEGAIVNPQPVSNNKTSISNPPIRRNLIATTSTAEGSTNNGQMNRDDNVSRRLNELLTILLAESINSREKALTSQIREVQRCLATFDSRGIRKLLRTLKDEHRKRTSYLLYLQQSRLTLLQLNYNLYRAKVRIQREKSLTGQCLIEILVRFNLEKKDLFLRQFIHDFQLLKAQDEKTDAVIRALNFLNDRLLIEPMWRFATPENLDYAKKSLERALMAHIYAFALYPNGEADHCRDEVFCKSMQKLSTLINVSHVELGIPKKFHGECPWPSAQAEIAIINAYKSPCDKMGCVVRCCETIENLISLASDRGVASADDILPVLVYVLLQANPPSLLSNIQYIEDFYASRIQGKEAYWWTQFTSAVEFVKQLLNKLLI